QIDPPVAMDRSGEIGIAPGIDRPHEAQRQLADRIPHVARMGPAPHEHRPFASRRWRGRRSLHDLHLLALRPARPRPIPRRHFEAIPPRRQVYVLLVPVLLRVIMRASLAMFVVVRVRMLVVVVVVVRVPMVMIVAMTVAMRMAEPPRSA